MIYSQGLSPTTIYGAVDLFTEERVVLKEIKKSKLVATFMQDFAKNECAIHYSLSNYTNCENIVRIKEYFENDYAYYLIMECSPDPNFLDDLLENKYRPINNEAILKAYALDILNGLVEIHKNNIIHCDIKPQNFLLFYNDDQSDIPNQENELSVCSFDANSFLKITDFGLSHIIPEGSSKAYMKFRCGTFGYCAPEVGKDSFVDQSIDMWAFGLCLYQMAVAYLPTAIKQYKYGSGPLPFRKIDWNDFNFEQVKNLIEGCVQMDPSKRLTAREAIDHPWFELD